MTTTTTTPTATSSTVPARLARLAAPGLLLFALFATASPARAASIGTASEPVTIIGGAPSLSCAWPSTVFLENCTGTLIHPEIVVYAAHCGDDRERVWFGEDVSTGAVPDGQGFSVDTEYCMTNPGWDTAVGIGEARANDYAFCKLAEPVLDVPIVPPAMGCETTVLVSGTPVTLVGFGGTDQETFGVKFQVDTVLHYIDDFGAAVIGGGGQSPCAGDSGGPAFVQLPDGSWRSFGIVSGPNVGNCSDAMWFATIFNAVPFIEEKSGIDVSVCHHSHGEWNPSPQCESFPAEPGDGEGKSWADGCAGGPEIGTGALCGAPFDASEDLVGPEAAITAPEDRARLDTEPGDDVVLVEVSAEAADGTSGVSTVQLSINGSLVDGSLRLGPPWAWPINLPPGVWDLQAVATDWAGNEAYSESVVVGVDTDPPPKPDPPAGTSTGAGADSTGDDPENPPAADDTGAGTTTTGAASDGGSSGDGGAQSSEDGGCGCRQRAAPASTWAWLLFAGLAGRRRRRAAALSSTLLAACSDPAPTSADTDATTTATTGMNGVAAGTTDTVTDTGPVDPDTSSSGAAGSSSGESSSEGPGCEPGTPGCTCTAELTCGAGLSCLLDTCIECEAGTLTCPCVFTEGERAGTCDTGLYCFGGLCAAPQPCPFVRDGQCDEPRGTGLCLQGTDASDCCPTRPGVCEEASEGGPCPDGSDPLDCDVGTSSGSDSGGSSSGSDSDSGGGSSSSSSGSGSSSSGSDSGSSSSG